MPTLDGFGSLEGFALWGAVLVAGLAGSWHCAGMCGPFAGLASAKGLAPKLAYHAGRLATYQGLAAVLHGFGLGFRSVFHQMGIGKAGSMVFAVLVALWAGLLATGILESWEPLSRFSRRVGNWVGRTNRGGSSGLAGAFVLGLTSTLLPCIWLYGFLFLAASRTSYVEGAVLIGLFWSTNIPWLLASGAILSWMRRSFRGSRAVGGIFLAVVVAWAAWKGANRTESIDVIPGQGGASCCHPVRR